jgi:putative endonuclease
MEKPRQLFGRWGENLAVSYLEGKGYQIIERNYRTPYREIDLVVQFKNDLRFFEVKALSTYIYGLPEESITKQTREHLIAATQVYL